jgi:predicted aspartyl protease
VQVKVRLSNPEQPDRGVEQVEAMIDTGAPFSTMPPALVEKLALPLLAEGKTYASLEYAKCKAACEFVVSETPKHVTISLATLTALGLEFDLFTGVLKPVAATS